ncbi:MAG: hypothetical protein A07HR67_01714 [uncultured archaeon A07HR67]|nr:MAG: hypothetical protein A07HR67_01714 [uncultured archaeon A07HR67]
MSLSDEVVLAFADPVVVGFERHQHRLCVRDGVVALVRPARVGGFTGDDDLIPRQSLLAGRGVHPGRFEHDAVVAVVSAFKQNLRPGFGRLLADRGVKHERPGELGGLDRFFEVRKRSHCDRDAGLHVDTSPAVQPPVRNFSGIRPVRPLLAVARRDHVDVAVEHHDRLAFANTSCDLWAVLVRFADQLGVDSPVGQPLVDVLGGPAFVSGRIFGLTRYHLVNDLGQFVVDLWFLSSHIGCPESSTARTHWRERSPGRRGTPAGISWF